MKEFEEILDLSERKAENEFIFNILETFMSLNPQISFEDSIRLVLVVFDSFRESPKEILSIYNLFKKKQGLLGKHQK